jgi:phosphoglycerate dehydrogenase-like enzyme
VRVLCIDLGTSETQYDCIAAAATSRIEIVRYDAARPPAEQLAGVEAVVEIIGGVPTPPELVDAAAEAGVRFWQATSVGLDPVPVDALLARGVAVAAMPGAMTAVAVAEHALFLMLAVAKNLAAGQQNVRAGRFHTPLSTELHGKTLGLVGLGASGRELARRALALEMRVLAVEPFPPADTLGVELVDLDTLLAESDYVSLHLPLTPETRHTIDARALARMKPGAVLVNCARGGLVDTDALVDALRGRRIRGAGLDVHELEPLPLDSPVLGLDNAVVTGHVAGVTHETAERRGRAVIENLERLARGEQPRYCVAP